MIARLYLNRCPFRPNSLEAARSADTPRKKTALIFASFMTKTDIIWSGATIKHTRSGFDISCGDLKLNLKCFPPPPPLGGEGEASYLPLFGLKHSQQYPTSLPI